MSADDVISRTKLEECQNSYAEVMAKYGLKRGFVDSGELYSKEHSKRFKADNATMKLEQSKDNPSIIRLTINGTSIHDWFRQKRNHYWQPPV